MPRFRSSFSSAGALTLALLVVGLPLVRGGVDLWAEGIAVALALAALAAATETAPALPFAALPLVSVLAFATLQLVPLPAAVHSISPGALRVFEVSLGPLGLYPAARPLSLDVASSARELAKAIACTAAFAAAWTFSSTRRRKERVLLGLAFSGVASAAVVLGAALAGMGSLLAPRFPFVNPNHLAGFLNLAAFVALGLAFRAHGQGRALWALGFVSVGAAVFLSLSRGGIAAFFVGAAISVGLHVRSRRAEEQASHAVRQGLRAGALAAAVGVAAYLAVDPVLAELRTLRSAEHDAKVRLTPAALQVVRDFPLVGIGRGAFPTVFAGYQSETSAVMFTHIENEWLQAIVDLGIPAGLLLVGTFVWIWVGAARRRDLSPTEIGLLAGTGALAAQNAFDFSLGILGVAIPFAVAMGLLARPQRPVAIRPTVLRAGLAAALLGAGVALAVGAVHGLDQDRDRVERASGALATSQAARDALRWHPADWIPHATAGGRVGVEQGCAEAMPWLLRAMALDPFAPSPHVAAARCLVGRDDLSARREYRLAILFGQPALAEAAVRYPRLADLLDVAPATPDGLLSLGHLLAGAQRLEDASSVFGRLVEEFADDRGVLPLAHARGALGDHEGALALARRHALARPSDPGGWLSAAHSLIRLDREDDARAELERGLTALPGSPALLGLLAERAMAAKRWSEAKRLAEEIAPRTPADIAGKHLLVARTLAGQGRIGEALERAKSAAAANTNAQAPWLVVAAYATQAERHDEAIAALRHAAALPGAPSDGHARRIAELEAAQAAALERTLARRALHGAMEGERLP